MKISKKHLYQLSSISLLVLMLGSFTQCLFKSKKKVVEAVRAPAQDPVRDPSPEEILNQTVVSVGIKNHEQMLHTMAALTGVASTDPDIVRVYNEVTTTLPTTNDLKIFLSPNQIAATKLAAEFCHEMIEDQTKRSALWPEINFGQTPKGHPYTVDAAAYLVQRISTAFWGEGVLGESELIEAQDNLMDLVFDILVVESDNKSYLTMKVAKGVCTATLASAYVTFL